MPRSTLTEWDKFCKTVNTNMGFAYYSQYSKAKITLGDFNRFSARYSIAMDFDKIKIKGSSRKTEYGYEALMRSLLVWSVVEMYCYIFKSAPKIKANSLIFSPNEQLAIRASLRNNNHLAKDLTKFYTFIASVENCDIYHKANTISFLNNNPYNPLMLLSAVRHVFGHGELCAHVKGVKPKSIYTIVNILKDEVLKKVDDEFTSLVKQHPSYAKV